MKREEKWVKYSQNWRASWAIHVSGIVFCFVCFHHSFLLWWLFSSLAPSNDSNYILLCGDHSSSILVLWFGKNDPPVPIPSLVSDFFFNSFMIATQREREAETQAEGEAGSIHRECNVGLDPGSPGSRPGPKAGAKPLCHPGIPWSLISWR